ncbi:hypothetical protein TESG_07225 [Trichophyton tonsurans CBS 112818]|uniref:Uncharacterized protein n=1 Tax=Trichophyton tonsurans (strain CBS 112818) TaxID=647933 RepID=F2S8J4_TRIT1|nr:hypothetical protein TESG_07225 [Trichophyton tonsurans CBS 112818]
MTGGRTGEPCLCENWSTKSRPCMQTTARSVFQANLRQGGSCYCYPVSLCGCWMYSINLEAASRVTSSSPSCLEVEEMKSLLQVERRRPSSGGAGPWSCAVHAAQNGDFDFDFDFNLNQLHQLHQLPS